MAIRNGRCVLCGKEGQLVDAHLIPKCLYDLEEGQARLVQIGGTVPPKRTNTGLYDSSILCGPCDNRFSVWEKHVCEKLTGNQVSRNVLTFYNCPIYNRKGEPLAYVFDGCDPVLVAKFAVSVVFRCHHSTKTESKPFQLGPHEKSIRSYLDSGLNDTHQNHPVILEYHEDFPYVLFTGRERLVNLSAHAFSAKSFTFHVHTDQRRLPEYLLEIALQKGRPVVALNVRKTDSKFGKRIIAGLKENQRKFGNPWGRAGV